MIALFLLDVLVSKSMPIKTKFFVLHSAKPALLSSNFKGILIINNVSEQELWYSLKCSRSKTSENAKQVSYCCTDF